MRPKLVTIKVFKTIIRYGRHCSVKNSVHASHEQERGVILPIWLWFSSDKSDCVLDVVFNGGLAQKVKSGGDHYGMPRYRLVTIW